MSDLQDYEQIVSKTVSVKQRFVQLWSGNVGYQDGFGRHAQMPATFLLDKTGNVVDSWRGRIPAEAWDRIAELL